MSEDRPRLGAGDVQIFLDDDKGGREEFTLRPSYNAARVLSNQAGGIFKMMQRVLDGDVDAVVSIIQAGCGFVGGTRRGPKDLPDRVWATGLSDEAGGLAQSCITYLRILMAGGRPPKSMEGTGEGTEDPQK